jgi:putative ATP-dependent endonuclease of OLD family
VPVSSEYIKLCNNGQVILWIKIAQNLKKKVISFRRFLDDTKANLSLQKVYYCRSYSENIIIPAIAELIGKPLYKYGISIVNVAVRRYYGMQRYL